MNHTHIQQLQCEPCISVDVVIPETLPGVKVSEGIVIYISTARPNSRKFKKIKSILFICPLKDLYSNYRYTHKNERLVYFSSTRAVGAHMDVESMNWPDADISKV